MKISMDSSLPETKKIKLRASTDNSGVRVLVQGWVHRLRTQGKGLNIWNAFFELTQIGWR